MTSIDDLTARILHIEETLQIGECPPLEGCHPHADIVDETQKHLPKLHASAGEHSDGGRDILDNIATQIEDIEIIKQGVRYVLNTGLGTDPKKWAYTVDDSGERFYLQYFDEVGTVWVTVCTWDKDGNFKPEGPVVADPEIIIVGDPPCLIWHRTLDDDEYRICATTLGLEVTARPTGTGPWLPRVTIPRGGWTKGDVLGGGDDGSIGPVALGPEGFGLASSAASPRGLAWSSFGTPTSQVPGIVPIGGFLPYAGSLDPGLQPDGSSYFLCDGRSLLDTNHPDLFAIIGYNYGGAGSSFNIPDMTDRLPLGVGRRAIGEAGGAWSHQHEVLQVPSHAHTGSSPAHSHAVDSHTHNGGSFSAAAHDHAFDVPAHGHDHDLGTDQHDHGVGTLVAANHSHDAGSLTVAAHSHNVPSVTENPQLSGTSGNWSMRETGSGQGGNGAYDTSDESPGLTGSTAGSGGSPVNGRTAMTNVPITGSIGAVSGAVGGLTASGGGGAVGGESGAASPGTSADAVTVTIDATGVVGALTELGDNEGQVLTCNYVIRVL